MSTEQYRPTDAQATTETDDPPPLIEKIHDPADDDLVWTADRRRNMQVHVGRPIVASVPGELLTWGDARRAYDARLCRACWPKPTDRGVRHES